MVIARTTTASGRLMKKIQRHDVCSMSHPPSTGPSAAVIAVNPDHVPIARPRSSLRKRRADERQAARHEQRGAHSLHGASRDELTDAFGKGRTTPTRRRR